jgi:hypothetical protein
VTPKDALRDTRRSAETFLSRPVTIKTQSHGPFGACFSSSYERNEAMGTPDPKQTETAIPTTGPAHVVEVTGATLGAVGGAATGAAMAGPVGAVVGAVIGGAIGASSGWAAEKASADEAEIDAALDEEIGVTAGSIGSPNLKHPPSKINAPSVAASGAGNALNDTDDDAAGPIQPPPG